MSNVNLTAQKQRFSVAITTETYKTLISNTLGDPERSRRFVAAITSAVAVNPTLQECTPSTILAGGLLGESLNLSPSPQLGQYYLVPFKKRLKDKDGNTLWVYDEEGKHVLDKNKRWLAYTESIAQFVLGYKGYIQLAIRSGQYRDIDVMEVHDGEFLGKSPETGKPMFRFIEDDEERESRPVVGYLAYFEYLNGFRKSLYWKKSKMLAHADKYSEAFSAEGYEKLMKGEVKPEDMWMYSSYWYKDFDGMAKKTMIRQLISKWGVMSIEMQQGYVSDSKMIQMGDDGSFVETDPEQTDPPEQSEPEQPEVQQEPEAVNLDDL